MCGGHYEEFDSPSTVQQSTFRHRLCALQSCHSGFGRSRSGWLSRNVSPCMSASQPRTFASGKPSFIRPRVTSRRFRGNFMDEQTAVLGERREVAVCVQQRYATCDAPGRDQAIHCLAHCNPASAQAAIVIHGRERRCRAAYSNLRKSEQRAARRIILPIGRNPAQYFQQHKVADKDLSRIVLARVGVERVEQRAQRPRSRCGSTAEMVDPDRTVDEDRRRHRADKPAG